jgi:hypothetical protein
VHVVNMQAKSQESADTCAIMLRRSPSRPRQAAMRSAALSWSEVRESRTARRGVSLLLTVLAHLAILLLLLRWTAFDFHPPGPDGRLTTFNLAPEAQVEERRTVTKTQARRSSKSPPPPPPQTPPPVPREVAKPWVLMPGLEQFDLRQVKSEPVERPSQQAADSSEVADSGSTYGPTSTPGAPGGGRLFNAEWYREPTDAELAFYMPRGVVGWGVIACQTVERFHVDNCREIGDSPPGSGMARAVREAAWQFLVRPPRVNGKPLIGAWVRIRIDLTPNGSKAR